MNYLINTRELQYCKMADALYRNWYNYSEIDTGSNVLPIYQEIKETYQRYKTPAPDQKKIEVRKDEIKSFPEIGRDVMEVYENLRNSLPEIAQGITKAVERLKGSTDADEKSLMYRNTERNDEQLKDWLSRYERVFIKTYDTMIMPTGHDEKIWMYKNIKPNETRLYGLDIEGIAQVTATEVRMWQFIIDNLPFYEKYVFTDKPQQSDFDDAKHENGRKMNLDLLDYLFIPAMTRGNKPTKLDLLKNDLRAKVSTYKAYQITALAVFIHNNGTLHRTMRPKTFTDWLKQFCEIIDYHEITTYKRSSKQVKDELIEMKNTYQYFIP